MESISAEEREFIEAGKPQRLTAPSVREEPSPTPKDEAPTAKEEAPAPRKSAAPRKSPTVTAPPAVLVSQTYRLPADLIKELTMTAVARKLERTPPWSQQDIVAEALREWLHKHVSKQASM
jgi:hypothetical protein